jgi:hypothetical protein
MKSFELEPGVVASDGEILVDIAVPLDHLGPQRPARFQIV